MRKFCLLASLCLIAATAAAQTESVTVEKNRNLSGLWRIQVPQSVSINFLRDAKFGPMRDIFCRIENNLDIHCLNGGYSRNGTVMQDGDSVHIAWGSMMARFAIDGRLAGNSISGKFIFKLSGLPHEAPASSNNFRFTGAMVPQDGGKASVLASYLQSLKGADALPRALKNLGAVEQIVYLGTSPRLDGGGASDYFSVYAMEFAGGERICGVHQRSDGTGDAFPCV
jgi:hypothetical protein